MVVRVDDVGVVLLRARFDVVAWDDEPPAVPAPLQLNPSPRAGRIPGPVGLLDVRRDLPRLRPGPAIVAGAADEHPAGIPAGLIDNSGLRIVAPVPGVEKPEDAGPLVADQARVAAGVRHRRPE